MTEGKWLCSAKKDIALTIQFDFFYLSATTAVQVTYVNNFYLEQLYLTKEGMHHKLETYTALFSCI